MSALGDLLERRGLDLSEADVVADFEAALDAVPLAAPLTDSEHALLDEQGGPLVREVLDNWDPETAAQRRKRATLRNTEQLLASSLSVKEAAQRIGVDRSGMQRRIDRGQVYSFRTSGRTHRIPSWQIVGGRLLAHLGEIIAHIPSGVSPLSVEGLMTTEQDEIGGQTPVEYLSAGGGPEPVCWMLDSLARW